MRRSSSAPTLVGKNKSGCGCTGDVHYRPRKLSDTFATALLIAATSTGQLRGEDCLDRVIRPMQYIPITRAVSCEVEALKDGRMGGGTSEDLRETALCLATAPDIYEEVPSSDGLVKSSSSSSRRSRSSHSPSRSNDDQK